MALSPMMQQYLKVKEENPDCLILFRLGDFYELFFDDAKTASRVLELTLTGRACGLEERAPMCGVPYHSADTYIPRLVASGYKVAICEQMEDPATAKGIVRREVVRIITPGTLDIAGSTAKDENVYIASVVEGKSRIAIAYGDVTTGELACTQLEVSRDFDPLISELVKISPKEIIYDESDVSENLKNALADVQISAYLNPLDSSFFRKNLCEKTLLSQFQAASLISLDLDGKQELVQAVGGLLLYLADTQKQEPEQFKRLDIRETQDYMQLDRSTLRNLELLETLYDKNKEGSLLGVLDYTHTAMGARLLKRFIKEPLNNSDKINLRLEGVEAITQSMSSRNVLVSGLKEIYDFERLSARIASGRANGKDLVALKNTLGALPEIKNTLETMSSAQILQGILYDIDDFDELYRIIDDSIVEEPPFIITEGNLIREGYSRELDDLKESIREAKEWIAGLEQSERERTGIKTIKVGFNKVFGYYIDVSKSYSDKVPENYVRKQTLVNNERYITPELKEKESLVLSAEAKINALEYEIFRNIRTSIEPYIEQLQRASSAVALLDVLVSFADVATNHGYVKPTVDDSGILDIREGRHPAVEQMLGSGLFVSNDTHLDTEGESLLLITGPNMSGKSTYMRQTAIIVLMAQIGSFVPCREARIGVCDRVFTRIGASDNLASGQSTFFIEMSELANILRNSTRRSLIILDEIGRGTSTFDGLSIAWATAEFLSQDDHRVRTMFATHYHELTVLENQLPAVRNFSVAVSDSGSNVVFLHKIIEGPASKSYGIHVAKIAGIPKEIRQNAARKLKELEKNASPIPLNEQITFFDAVSDDSDDEDENSPAVAEATSSRYDEVVADIEALDINNMSPIDALLSLQKIQQQIHELHENEDE
jgi:DNA mismatch repair protein MutS